MCRPLINYTYDTISRLVDAKYYSGLNTGPADGSPAPAVSIRFRPGGEPDTSVTTGNERNTVLHMGKTCPRCR